MEWQNVTEFGKYLGSNTTNADLVKMAQEINQANGDFDNYLVYENDEEFFNMFFSNDPYKAVRGAFYGTYNPSEPFVRFDGYENLESFESWKIEDEAGGESESISSTYLDLLDTNSVEEFESHVEDVWEEFIAEFPEFAEEEL